MNFSSNFHFTYVQKFVPFAPCLVTTLRASRMHVNIWRFQQQFQFMFRSPTVELSDPSNLGAPLPETSEACPTARTAPLVPAVPRQCYRDIPAARVARASRYAAPPPRRGQMRPVTDSEITGSTRANWRRVGGATRELSHVWRVISPISGTQTIARPRDLGAPGARMPACQNTRI